MGRSFNSSLKRYLGSGVVATGVTVGLILDGRTMIVSTEGLFSPTTSR